jgi:guanyl-specific ribonuclease Sa
MIEIGRYKIEWINEDEMRVTEDFGKDFVKRRVVCGGDMETLLSCLFTTAHITTTNQRSED